MKSLVSYLDPVTDTRKPKGIRHKQTMTLVIMIRSIRCGYTGFNAMARFAKSPREKLLSWMPLPRGKTPSSSTRPRLSQRVNRKEIGEAFNQWMLNYYQLEVLAIDGKSINRTVTHCHDSQPNFVSMVSFFGQRSQLIWQVGQLETANNSEIHPVQALWSWFSIETAVFTLDALPCQKKP